MAPLLEIDPSSAATTSFMLPYIEQWLMGVDQFFASTDPYELLLGVDNYGGSDGDWRRVAISATGAEVWQSGNSGAGAVGHRYRGATEMSLSQDHAVLDSAGVVGHIALWHVDWSHYSGGSSALWFSNVPLADGTDVIYSTLRLCNPFMNNTSTGHGLLFGQDGAGAAACWELVYSQFGTFTTATKHPLATGIGTPIPVKGASIAEFTGGSLPEGQIYFGADAVLRHVSTTGVLSNLYDFSSHGAQIIAGCFYSQVVYVLVGTDGGTSFTLCALSVTYGGVIGAMSVVGTVTTPQPLHAVNASMLGSELGGPATTDPVKLWLTDASWVTPPSSLVRLPDQAHVAEVRAAATLRPSSRVA